MQGNPYYNPYGAYFPFANGQPTQQQIQAYQRIQQSRPKPIPKEKVTLTESEKEDIMQYWKLRNFGEFNNWVQTAKGKGDYEISEISQTQNGNKLFQCKGKVSFSDYHIPTFEGYARGQSRKDAKFNVQEIIVKKIMDEGWIRIGFKEDDFVQKLRNELNKKLLGDKQEEAQKKAEQERQNTQMYAQKGGLRIGDIANLPPIPDNSKNLEKNYIHKISRKMQDYLKEDKFMEACQELCKIVNKKNAEWNEINSIWCYAILKKNIVYLKCILDIIQEKTDTQKNNQQLKKQKEQQKLDQKQQQQKQQTQKNDPENEKLMNDELQRRYGQNIRLETNNPYDVKDTYNVIVNKPDIDETAQKVTDKDNEQELVNANPYQQNLDQKMHVVNVSQEEQKTLNEQFTNFKEEFGENGKVTQNPQKRIQTEDNSEKQNVNLLESVNPNSVLQNQSKKTKKGFNDGQDVNETEKNKEKTKGDLLKYKNELEQYLQNLENGKDKIDINQYSNLKYYYSSLVEQVQSQIIELENLQPNNNNNQIEVIEATDNNDVRYKVSSDIVLGSDYGLQQQHISYLKSNLNQDILQEKVLKNLTMNKKAFLIQQDSQPIIDSYTAREVKDPNYNYLSYQLVKEMYDQLLYCGDLNFALNVSELLYTKVRLNDDEFINSQACNYWANKQNIIMVELLESIFQVFARSKSKPVDFLMNVDGNISKKGNKQQQEVILFQPLENQKSLENKIVKRGQLENRDMYHQIAEGEFIMLTSLSGQKLPTEEELRQMKIDQELKEKQAKVPKNPFSLQGSRPIYNELPPIPSNYKEAQKKTGYKDTQNSLISFINACGENEQEQTEEQKMFYNTVTEKGNSVEYAMIAFVRTIEKDYTLKLFTLPTQEQKEAFEQVGRRWKVTKLVNKTTHEKTMEALDIFCTKINMSHTLNQILMTPPICNAEYIRKLSETKVQQQRSMYVINTNLNQSQQQALKAATTQCLTLIQGPPGTGKTTTAVEIVLEWCRQSTQQILACADSNVAVDILHCEFQKAGLRSVRIGPGYDERNEIMHDPRYRNMKIQQSLGNIQQAGNIRYQMMRNQIKEAQVICATNVGCMSEFLDDMQFSRVIVDEATQSTEVTCLIPVIKGSQQLVLIGDHKQLPPTVLSVFAQSKGLTVSLFERLIKQGVKPQMLIEQYRMHPSIALFPSHQFYNNLLKNGVGETHRPIIKGFTWPNQYVRVAIVNVNGQESIYSSSIQNNKEVEVVIEILLQMLKGGMININQIGIITPYDAQKRRIRNEVNHQARKFPHLFGLNQQKIAKLNRNSIISDVDTVDGYQGMERDVIIISTVRSNTGGNLGFLKDPRRMNVALTRAKRGLIIVGNIETLSCEENWRDLINWGKANKILINYY
ncbi:P-loop containing nucleoside triphosphate hydrolase [Pseudocohnilembus persalinus]|uniref:p-loop containing nucleoside triphosphate hydrolase n=1 Tax=Pseudocohnilembus persalinus TaxID=266149 RepID=A0A0V0Q9U1_PSEPJ|nr:P-loop containing nucleoside triphosphate hydrolase [Pseudocohnilembus persalinus]|eukprot:KRW99001.1 P-loop containing nucleoside triphosphate hydrolase [Pseudocohnilembus persalinus]